jgi:O-antigen/teichoic acid export membrane protein
MTLVPQATGEVETRQLITGAFGLQLMVSMLLAAVLVAGFYIALQLGLTLSASVPVWVVAATGLLFQLQDWVRRSFFSTGRIGRALVSDCVAYGGQLAGIFALAQAGRLTVLSGFLCIAFAYSMGFSVGVLGGFAKLSVRSSRMVLRDFVHLGRGHFISGQLQWLGSQGVLFISAGALSTASAGAIRAVQNLLGPINVLFQAMDNFVPIQAGRLLARDGEVALSRYLTRIALTLGLPFGLFLGLVSVFSDDLLGLAYGPAFVSYGHLIPLYALCLFFAFACRLLSYWRRVLRDMWPIAMSSLFWAIAANGIAVLTIHRYQEAGAMLGSIAGALAAALTLLFWPRKR